MMSIHSTAASDESRSNILLQKPSVHAIVATEYSLLILIGIVVMLPDSLLVLAQF